MASASRSNKNNSSSETSYTAMDADLDDIGAHCQMEYCRQLDFLPFKCMSCSGKFCLDHRTETAHKCTHEGQWARNRARLNGTQIDPSSSSSSSTTTTTTAPRRTKASVLTHEAQCAHLRCKTLIDTGLVQGVQCTRCNRRYCLKHRLQEDHDCKSLIPLGIGRASSSNNNNNNKNSSSGPTSKERGLAALAKLRAWTASKREAAGAATSTLVSAARPAASVRAQQQAAALTTLKATAKGDASVPAAERVYLHVEASTDTTRAKHPSAALWFGAAWSVGRLLDGAAKALQVQNVNNQGGGEEVRLRVFHVEGGRVLGFGEKVGSVLASGNTVVLVRGVGDPDVVQSLLGD